jgi:hypothetical protein
MTGVTVRESGDLPYGPRDELITAAVAEATPRAAGRRRLLVRRAGGDNLDVPLSA